MSKIIKFDPSKIPLTPKHGGYCRHYQLYVVEKYRHLECRKCGAIIDPFDFLFSWACEDYHLDANRKHLKKECRRLSDGLKELKRQERNIKARIKRAGHRLKRKGASG